jgi:hypothetical protein
MTGEGVFDLSQRPPRSGHDLSDRLDYFTIRSFDSYERIVIREKRRELYYYLCDLLSYARIGTEAAIPESQGECDLLADYRHDRCEWVN